MRLTNEDPDAERPVIPEDPIKDVLGVILVVVLTAVMCGLLLAL